MSNPFASEAMAAGYATARPPVHPRVIALAARRLGIPPKRRRALDIGCGAGLSTAPLELLAEQAFGVEPAVSMLPWTRVTAPRARCVAAAAEALPFASGAFDILTAAGSVNYVGELGRFFAEAARVLVPGGALVVYDFAPGRTLADSPALDEWFAAFTERYPPPVSEAREITPGILAEMAHGFVPAWHESFEVGLPFTAGTYAGYAMTETNVASAVRRGVPFEEIRRWCEESLARVFPDEREVLFRGYLACLLNSQGRTSR